jgi:hypothetical protein
MKILTLLFYFGDESMSPWNWAINGPSVHPSNYIKIKNRKNVKTAHLKYSNSKIVCKN